MKQVNLVQGSPEWLEHRRNHFNASDAPAMLGVSKYKTRDELLYELKTGITKDVDPETQKRFDEGHRIEALARPLAEIALNLDLYPVVGYEGKYGASFDGIDMMETTAFEHKTLNDDIRAALANGDANQLPEMYTAQMEQQLMVSGAERVYFLATKWDDDELLEQLSGFYYSNAALRQRIVDGWAQFEKDLADYVPAVIAEKPKADTIMDLPALSILIKGEVTFSNLPEFKAAADSFIASIKTDLVTDEDFANAEATVKFCERTEKEIEMAKKAAIAQTSSIDELMRTLDFVKDELRKTRLQLNKDVEAKKEQLKLEIVTAGRTKFAEHVASLEAETKPIRLMLHIAQPDFAGAIKSKRTLATLHDAVNTCLANGKIAADEVARDVRAKLAWCKEHAEGYGFLFSDLQQLIVKPMDDFQLVINTRISEHKRIEQEKADKLLAEAAQSAQVAKTEPVAQAEPQEALAFESAPQAIVEQPKPDMQMVVVENQDVISEFMKSRDFGKDENKIRAVLVEFVKFNAAYGLKVAA